jgi:hypothetical protein
METTYILFYKIKIKIKKNNHGNNIYSFLYFQNKIQKNSLES